MERNSTIQKLHGLASEVVASFATPDPVLRELARHPEFMTMPRETRIVQIEDFNRQSNDLMARNAKRDGQVYMCECANPYCNVNTSGEQSLNEAGLARPRDLAGRTSSHGPKPARSEHEPTPRHVRRVRTALSRAGAQVPTLVGAARS
jgi:hypothetical protein